MLSVTYLDSLESILFVAILSSVSSEALADSSVVVAETTEGAFLLGVDTSGGVSEDDSSSISDGSHERKNSSILGPCDSANIYSTAIYLGSRGELNDSIGKTS